MVHEEVNHKLVRIRYVQKRDTRRGYTTREVRIVFTDDEDDEDDNENAEAPATSAGDVLSGNAAAASGKSSKKPRKQTTIHISTVPVNETNKE